LVIGGKKIAHRYGGTKARVGIQESGVAGVAEYASKVFIRESRTSMLGGQVQVSGRENHNKRFALVK
jgi:hypothetical protein